MTESFRPGLLRRTVKDALRGTGAVEFSFWITTLGERAHYQCKRNDDGSFIAVRSLDGARQGFYGLRSFALMFPLDTVLD